MRLRLRSLFAPTDTGDDVARLIDLRGRELEERSHQLRSAVSELERREERARELNARVEQILRDGAVELDLRQAELTRAGAELERRERAVADAEEELEARRRELGAVELRRATVERREEALRARELELETRAAELEELTRDLDEGRRAVAGGNGSPGRADEHVAITSAGRYRVLVLPGPAPELGAVVDAEGGPHRCVQLTVSPFPSDDRRCAVLEPVSPAADG
jgi:hypothetical protein